MSAKKPGNKSRLSPFPVIMVFLGLILIGTSLLPSLNIRLNPSRSLPSVIIRYYWNDASARVLEQHMTSPLEGVLSSIRGIKNINSVSRKGSGTITLEFDKGTNMNLARFEVSTAVRRVSSKFPEQAGYPDIMVNTGSEHRKTLMTYTLSGNAPPIIIQKYARNHIMPELLQISGLDEVQVYGATPWEYKIIVNTDQLQTLNISTDQLRKAILSYHDKRMLGFMQLSPSQDNQISVLLQNVTHEEDAWGKIPVSKIGSRLIYLTDVATVNYVEQSPSTYYRINGLNTINIVLYSKKGVNELKIGKSVHEAVDNLKTELPGDYALLKSYDTTEFIQKEVSKTAFRSLLSLIFLMVFVLAVSRSWKYLLLISVSLIANLIIAVILYHLLKLEIHLYSLAGITVSFGIIIDNSIVMIDHYRHTRNRHVFLAVLAATLTTIGSLSVIFFLKEAQRINLIDFSWVMIANLIVSLFIALLFIPSLIEKLELWPKYSKKIFKRKRKVVVFNRRYQQLVIFIKRFRWAFIILLIFGFGIPLHLLPEKMDKPGFWPETYNKTLGSDWFSQNIRPIAEKIIGGSLRLFSENVFEQSFYNTPERTRLYVRGSMPEGSTIHQLNKAIEKMENYIAGFDEVETFETKVYSYDNSNITISFTPEEENGSFPYFLKNELTSKAIGIGGLDWSIYGVGRGFSNALYDGYKSNQIILEGYNYDKLYAYASILKDSLEHNMRVKDLEIAGRISWGNRISDEFYLEFNPEKLAVYNTNPNQFFNALKEQAYATNISPIYNGTEYVPVRMVSDKAEAFNTWKMRNLPVEGNEGFNKVKNLGLLEKRPIGSNIYRNNQQYTLTVAWDFIGPPQLAKQVQDKQLENIQAWLPVGFNAINRQYSGWDKGDKSQYYLIFLVIAIIYFICAIVLESLIQPLSIILLVPFSFIGVFLTFYLFDFNFDQGGFASFILLAGIVVNSALYVINDFNNYRKLRNSKSLLKKYIKAYNHKILPVVLTILSTVLGLVPFVIGGQKEPFWFSFAVGAMGGLLFSLIAVIVYFPIFINLNVKNTKKQVRIQKYP